MTFIDAFAELAKKTNFIRRESWADGDCLTSDIKIVNIYGESPTTIFDGAKKEDIDATDWELIPYRDESGTFAIDENGDFTIDNVVYDINGDNIESIIDVFLTYTNILLHKEVDQIKADFREALEEYE